MMMANDRTRRNLRRAAALIAKTDALLITAGAGMSVDSGLPDFRGGQGFWRAYPPLEALTRIEQKLPERFRSAAKAGLRIERPTATVLPADSRVGLEAVSAQDLEMLEFDVAPVAEPGNPACWSSAASPIDLGLVTLIDLVSGQVGPFNYLCIEPADQRACQRWVGTWSQGFDSAGA